MTHSMTTQPPAVQSKTDTQEKLRLNLDSLSVSELSEYRRKIYSAIYSNRAGQFFICL